MRRKRYNRAGKNELDVARSVGDLTLKIVLYPHSKGVVKVSLSI